MDTPLLSLVEEYFDYRMEELDKGWMDGREINEFMDFFGQQTQFNHFIRFMKRQYPQISDKDILLEYWYRGHNYGKEISERAWLEMIDTVIRMECPVKMFTGIKTNIFNALLTEIEDKHKRVK